jgi:tripartite-type tricarboxylate transporter receptor subunit TctC
MMRLTRRSTLAAPLLLALPARAQDFPSRPVRLVVPFGAGGITDIVARIVAERAAAELGQPVVVENRAGAGGNIAGEFVARAPADGYTLLMLTGAMAAVNPVIYPRMPFDPVKDLAPVALAASTPHVLVANPAVPGASLAAVIAEAKREKERFSFGTAGAGSSPHQTRILFSHLSGAELLDVHFRSGAASVQAVLAGQVSMTAEATPVVAGHVRAGTLRALAVCAPERISLLPDVPTAAEAGLAGLENGSISGIAAPAATPAPILARLSQGFAAAVAAPELRERLVAQGTVALAGDGAAFRALIAAEAAKWAPLMQGVTPG